MFFVGLLLVDSPISGSSNRNTGPAHPRCIWGSLFRTGASILLAGPLPSTEETLVAHRQFAPVEINVELAQPY